VRVPALLGLVFAALAAVVSVHWLVRWFKTRNLTPFAIYCVVFGLATTVYFSVS
jgi:undecaprenyl-diphosphatase